ncbi:MAG: ribosomal L7Ae/L30e/S12e/Gadd45 family protein [Clostridiales bacterium]|nr:ribosomal L7Ae/L30e/S12e/Gadd45 family protein [Clostridiales bacterium]
MLGIAARAGRVSSGETGTEKAIKSGRAYLVIVAEDASENTQKKFRNSCEYYEVPMVTYGTREELGWAIGKEYRSSIAITDENLANAVAAKLV